MKKTGWKVNASVIEAMDRQYYEQLAGPKKRIGSHIDGSFPRTGSHGLVVPASLSSDPFWTEMPLIGRSNVGKSTLLNALLGADRDDAFVPTSRRPGCTRHLDFYAVGVGVTGDPRDAPPVGVGRGLTGGSASAGSFSPFVIVDTPGYGYNEQGRNAEATWGQLITRYLSERGQDTLPRVMVLMDARTGLTDLDREVIRFLEEKHVPWHLVMTKADQVAVAALEATAFSTAKELAATTMLAFPVLNAVSAMTGEGMKDLQCTVMQSVKLNRKAVIEALLPSLGKAKAAPIPPQRK
jgi:GTP-binding protein